MISFSTIAWFVVSLLMMGFFAGIEMAYYSVNRLGIELKKKQGKPGALILSKIIESPRIFLSTTIIGFIIFLSCFALLFSTVTQPMWAFFGLQSNLARVLLDITLATLIVIIFAEFIPRAFFRAKSTLILSRTVWVVNLFYQALKPVALIFLKLSDWLLKYTFDIRVKEETNKIPGSTADTLFTKEAEKDPEPQKLDTELFDNALNLHNVKVRQCLVPRKEIVGVEIQCTVEQAKDKFVETKLSKLIVYENNIDNIVGYIHQIEMFKNPQQLREILLPISAIPASMSAIDLITKFNSERKSIAWVVDEFGGTAGIVTMEDVLEEIFGEIHDEYDSEEFVEKQLSENEYIFSGRLELDYLREKYELQFTDDESETLSGFIISHHSTIPQQKERIIVDDYEFDILSVNDTRIEMVKLKILK